MDLEDDAERTGGSVCSGSLADVRACDIVVLAAGEKQKPGEPRTSLAERNSRVYHDIIRNLLPLHPSTIIVVVSNPVDILTSLVQKFCEGHLPASQIIGSGTLLDSLRFRILVSKKLNVSVASVHAHVLGEHGDSQVVAESSANVAGCSLTSLGLSRETINELKVATRNKVYDIIQLKVCIKSSPGPKPDPH